MISFHRPVVLEGATVPDFVRYILEQHRGLSTIVVCGTKGDFLDALRAPSGPTHHAERLQNLPDPNDEDSTSVADASQPSWTTPTLRMLSTSRVINVVFCPDITHLRAYLATHPQRLKQRIASDASMQDDSRHFLTTLNPIRVHRPTSAFSAQGLNRTFSAAVEAAYQSRSQLVITECGTEAPAPATDDEDSWQHDADERRTEERSASQSIWDEQVSILNVTTKSFGAGERGWVGRTVKLRTIAERWCTFEKLPSRIEP